jgi:hypothetical protein
MYITKSNTPIKQGQGIAACFATLATSLVIFTQLHQDFEVAHRLLCTT